MTNNSLLTELFDPDFWPKRFLHWASGETHNWPVFGFIHFTSHSPCYIVRLLYTCMAHIILTSCQTRITERFWGSIFEYHEIWPLQFDWSDIVAELYISSAILEGFYKNYNTALVGRVFANGQGNWGSIPGQVIPKTQKIVLDATMLNTPQYKV